MDGSLSTNKFSLSKQLPVDKQKFSTIELSGLGDEEAVNRLALYPILSHPLTWYAGQLILM
jgi:hypothetical protein